MDQQPVANGAQETDPIDVIVVGAGYAGLSCAIELKRKGCNVHLIERELEMQKLGKSDCLHCSVLV